MNYKMHLTRSSVAGTNLLRANLLKRFVALFVLSAAGSAAFSDEVVTREIETNRLAYDSVRNLIYATVPGIDPKLGNRVIALNPLTLEIVDSVYVGSEPESLDLSDSCQSLYVALRGASKIVRIDVPSFSVTQTINLGVTQQQLPIFAYRLEVRPGSEDVIAVMRTGAVAIYDNGVERPATVSTNNDVWNIAFSHDPGRLYAHRGEGSPNPFYRLQVSGSGVAVVSSTTGLLGTSDVIVYAGGRLYVRNVVIDPEALVVIGTYSVNGRVAPDVIADKVNFIDRQAGSTFMFTFDLTTFELLDSIEYMRFGTIRSYLRWGDSGVVWGTREEIHSVRTSQVWFDLHVPPGVLNPIRGLTVAGGLLDATTSDDQRIVLRPGPVFSTQQSPISIEFSANAPSLNEEHLAFTIESHATSSSVNQSVYLFDYDTQAYVALDERQCSNLDTKVKVEVWDEANRYIDESGNIKVRIDYRANGPVFVYPWEARIDMIRWTFINE